METAPLVAKAPVVAVVTFKRLPVVNPVPVLLISTASPVVRPLAVIFKVLPAVELAEERFKRLLAPVVETPVKLTTSPV